MNQQKAKELAQTLRMAQDDANDLITKMMKLCNELSCYEIVGPIGLFKAYRKTSHVVNLIELMKELMFSAEHELRKVELGKADEKD